MPQPDGQELGVRSPFNIRVGLDVPRFRGMNRQSDAGAIGDDQFWLIQNARIDGTGIKNRPGLSALFTEALSGCVYGIFDDLNPADDGNAIFWGDSSVIHGVSPEFWTAMATTTLSERIPVTMNGQHIIIGDSGTGYVFSYVTAAGAPTFSEDLLFTSASAEAAPVVRSAVFWSGAAWYLLSSGDTNNAEIWQFPGGSVGVLDTTLSGFTDIRSVLATDGSDLYVASQNKIRQRDDGAWTALSFPGGLTSWTLTGWYGVSRPPSIFFAGVDTTVAAASQVNTLIEVNNGTASIFCQDVPTYDGANNSYSDVAEYNGALWMIGPASNGSAVFWLWKIDGSGTGTAVLNLSTEASVIAPGSNCWIPVFVWRGQLYTILKTSNGIKMLQSAYGDFTKTGWSVLGAATLVTSDGAGQPIFTA